MGCKKENQSKLKEDKFIFKENVFAQTTTLGLEVSIPPGILNLQSHTHCGLKLTNRTRSVWLSAPSGIHVYFPRIELTWLLRLTNKNWETKPNRVLNALVASCPANRAEISASETNPLKIKLSITWREIQPGPNSARAKNPSPVFANRARIVSPAKRDRKSVKTSWNRNGISARA